MAVCGWLLRAQVKVKGTKGTNAFELPSAGFQRVVAVPNNEKELRVTIDLQNPKRASEEDRNDKEYMQPSSSDFHAHELP